MRPPARASVQPAAAPRAAEPLTILYATESGNSEKLAGDVAKSARKLGFKPSLVDMADLEVASLASVKKLIVIAATWGEGEPPARAIRAYKELMSDAAPRLDGVEFGVLALGDTAYVEFCAIGKALDERFAALGGKRVADRVDCDLDFAEPAATWIAGTLKTLAPDVAPDTKVIAVDFGAKAAPSLDMVEAEVTEHINLNSSRSDKETIHLELAFDGAAPAYKPGDSLDVYAENDPEYVDALLKAAGLSSDTALRGEFIKSRDVTTLSLKTVETYAASTGHQYVKELLASGDGEKLDRRPPADRSDRAFPDRARRREAARADAAAGAARLFDRVVAQRGRRGSASAGLRGALRNARPRAQGRGVELRGRAPEERRARARQAQAQQALRAAGARIATSSWSGRAPASRRSAPSCRSAAPRSAKGRNWLFFGDRTFTHDFLYQPEWQDALKDGGLTRMDVAFSRDTPEKIYVQHRIWEQRADLVAWLDGGASFYVCGDAKRWRRTCARRWCAPTPT